LEFLTNLAIVAGGPTLGPHIGAHGSQDSDKEALLATATTTATAATNGTNGASSAAEVKGLEFGG